MSVRRLFATSRPQLLAAAIAGVVMTSLAPVPTLADTARTLEEVIVTAQRREQSLQSVPIAVTSLSGADLERANIFSIQQVSQQTPSLNISQISANPATARITLRGQVQAETIFTADPSVGVYLDEVYLGRTQGAMFDFFDIQRVEVLKGPQGTLYGRNTTGGTIKLVPNKAEPDAGLTGYGKAGVGNYSARRLETGINVPLVAGVAALRLSGLLNQRDGYSTTRVVDSVTRAFIEDVDTNDKGTEALRVNLVVNASDQLTFELSADYADIQTNGSLDYSLNGDHVLVPNVSYERSSSDPLKGTNDFKPYANNRSSGASLTTTYDFTDSTQGKLIYAYRRQDGEYALDLDGSDQFFYNSEPFYGSEQQSAEAQLSGTALADRLEWTTGLFWFEESGYDLSPHQQLGYFGAALGAYDINLGWGQNDSQSAFVHGTYHFSDTLSTTLGLRWTDESRSVEAGRYRVILGNQTCQFSPHPSVDLANCVSRRSEDYDNLSWTAGLNWQLDPDILAYLKTSSGYRAGGHNMRAVSGLQYLPFAEETVQDVELGLKSTLLDNRLRVNLALYHSAYEDMQQLVLQPDVTVSISNLTDATIQGAEVEIEAQLSDAWVVDFSGSVIDIDFDDLPALGLASFPQGIQAVYTPEAQYSVGATWGKSLEVGELTANLGYTWRDSHVPDPSIAITRARPNAESEDIGLVNGRISLDIDSLDTTVSLWGTNLTDENYTENTLITSVFVLAAAQAPRMYGLDITKRF